MQPNPFAGMEPESMLQTLRQQADGLAAKAGRLREEITAATATASSADGAVTVTLSPTGALQDISFSAKASGLTPDELGPLVMRTVHEAQRQASARVEASVRQLGDESTMDFLRQFMPTPEPDGRVERDPEAEYGAVLRKRPGRQQ
ncbi:YbaB/EbfC family nucleoid-associated protein [Actinophytocola sp.]|jgi:DNA-binding protein YbaB|uniref:YbaB/EbfC family nucleoid-associated protein n=1 Tax=Actinophytocola sp. TaxID=1872138 RepID=UPI002ED9C140